MPPVARSLRLVAKNTCQCTHRSILRAFPSIVERRTFSTSVAQRAKEDEDEEEDVLDEREANLRRQIMRIPKHAKQKPGFQNQGEEPTGMTLEDEEFQEDDISSLAHGQLDEHRERREYLRIAAWEMPLLSSSSFLYSLLDFHKSYSLTLC